MMWQPAGSETAWSAFAAPVSVEHTDDSATITVDMPGVEPNDLDVTFEAGTLAISGKRGERTYNYTIALDDTIDPGTLEARLDKGVLTVRAYKRPEAKPRRILVNAASQNRLGTGEGK
jgi:HSP20 family protein